MATNYDLQQTGDELQERINTVPENSESIESLTELYNALQDSKADVATTLAGYGITDAYTKAAVDNMIGALSSQNIVVGALPASGEAGTIYRVPGNGSYTDYMWFDGAWKELATYSMEFDQTQVGYFVCDTAAATAAKVVAAPGYTLAVGGNMRIKMTNANTADAVTLNINGTGAKPLIYDGEQISSINTWEANDVLTVYYDGEQFQISKSIDAGSGSNLVMLIDGTVTPDVQTLYSFQTYKGRSYRFLNTSDSPVTSLSLGSDIVVEDIDSGEYVQFVAEHDNEYLTIIWQSVSGTGLIEDAGIAVVGSTIASGYNVLGTKVTGAYFLLSSGAIQEDSTDWCYNPTYFGVTAGTEITMSGLSTFSVVANIVFYNSNKEVVSAHQSRGSITVPDEAVYVRFCGKSSDTPSISNIIVETFSSYSEILEDIEDKNEEQDTRMTAIEDSLVTEDAISYESSVSGKILKVDGSLYSHGTGKYYIFPVQEGFTYYLTTTILTIRRDYGYAAYWFVDNVGAMLSCQELGTGEGDFPQEADNVAITAPTGARQLYVMLDNSLDASQYLSVINRTTVSEALSSVPALVEESAALRIDVDKLKPSVEINLPDEFYVVAGKSFQIFKYPLTLLSNYDAYGISISMSGGTCQNTKRFATITAAAGNYTLKVNVVDDNMNVLAQKTSTVHAVTAASPSSMKNILCIGDSETAGLNGTPYSNEMIRLLTSSDSETATLPAGWGLSNIQTIGSCNTSSARHEGHSGYAASTFVGSSSPFYINGAIDFNAYLDSDVYTDSSHKGVDLIYILLGINATLVMNIADGKLVITNPDYKTGLIELLTYIKAQLITDSSKTYYNPNLKVILLSYALTNTDAYDLEHNLEFRDGIVMAKKYMSCAKVNEEVAAMDEFSSFVKSKILSAQIDSENAYPFTAVKSNPYMDQEEQNSREGVHPSTIGYRMFGASVARDVVGELTT